MHTSYSKLLCIHRCSSVIVHTQQISHWPVPVLVSQREPIWVCCLGTAEHSSLKTQWRGEGGEREERRRRGRREGGEGGGKRGRRGNRRRGKEGKEREREGGEGGEEKRKEREDRGRRREIRKKRGKRGEETKEREEREKREKREGRRDHHSLAVQQLTQALLQKHSLVTRPPKIEAGTHCLHMWWALESHTLKGKQS